MPDLITRRDVLRAALGAAIASGSVLGHERAEAQERSDAVVGPEGAVPWYRRLLVGIEVGPTGANDRDTVYMSKATGKDIVENLLRAHAEYLVIFMKDMTFAYYDSAVARKCPNLGRRDLLRECITEAHAHDMPVIAYCQCQYDTSSWHEHPEWRMRDSDGREIPGRLCYNSGYVEFVKSVSREMMAYPISGFHFDMLDFGFGPPYGCWCDHCRARFREMHGEDLPAGVTWDAAWDRMLEFRCASNTRFCNELGDFVKATRPDVSVDFNYHGYPPFNWYTGQKPVTHARNGDFVTAEGLPWVFGHSNASLLPLFMAGARPEGPVQAVGSRGVFDYHDFTVRPTAEMKWEVLTYLAHGAQCTIVDKAYYDGSLEPLAYERLGEAFLEAQAKREYFGHKPIPEVGLYYSCRSRDWFGREDPPRYMRGFWGAHLALLQSHITMGIVIDEGLTIERLREFPVIYIPNAPVLSGAEVELLGQYVAGGGNLIVTGLTGMCDWYGSLGPEFALSRLCGATLVRCHMDHPDNYLRLPDGVVRSGGEFLARDVPLNWPMLVHGPLAALKPAGAQAFGELLLAYRSEDNQWWWHMSPERAIGPAITLNRHRRGQVVCVPCALDAAYAGDYHMPEHRNLIRNIVRFLNPRPVVLVEAPPNVEIVVTRDERHRRLLVHFLAFNGSMTFAGIAFPQGKRVLPPQMEEPMLYAATVRVDAPVRRAHPVSTDTEVTLRGNLVRLRTKSVHEVLVIEQ